MRRSYPFVIQVTMAAALATLVAACGVLDDNKTDGGGTNFCDKTIDCRDGQFCGFGGSCINKESVAAGRRCNATRDCLPGLFCSVTNLCAEPGDGRVDDPCLGDQDCTAGYRCEYSSLNGYCKETGQGDVGDACEKNLDCIAGLFCGGSHECRPFAAAFPPFAGVSCTDDADFKSYFKVPRPGAKIPDFYRLPYPTDVRVTTSGNRKNIDMTDFPRPGLTPLGVDLVGLYVDAFVEDFDGFGALAPVIFRSSKSLDLSVDLNDTIHIFDVTAGQRIGGIGVAFAEGKSKFACGNYLAIAPSLNQGPYKAGHTYLVLLKLSGLKANGSTETAKQDADLTAVLAPGRPTGDDAMGHAWDVFIPVRKYIMDNGIAAANVGNATVFTVGDTTGHMQRVAAAAAAAPTPRLSDLFLCGSGGTDACDDNTPARKCGADSADFVEIHGKIKLPVFQNGTAPYEKPSDGGGINETNGVVTKVKDEDVCFALTLPKGTMPAAGWPLVVYGHGTGGSFRSFISDGLAAKMATASPRAAMFGIDLVGHGKRRGTSTKKPDELVFNVLNPRAARDNELQGAADLLGTFRLPAAATPSGWTGPALKFAGKPLYFGHSQGSNHGILALPFTDEVQAAVLSGAGSFLALSLITKKQPVNVAEGLAFLLNESLCNAAGDQCDGSHPMITLWSNYFDRSDPANYDGLVIYNRVAGRSAKQIFMSWGKGDTFSPAATLEATAVFMGLNGVKPLVEPTAWITDGNSVSRPVKQNLTPPSSPSVTGAVFQYAPTDGSDGHFVAWRNASALADVTAFITSYFATGTASVP